MGRVLIVVSDRRLGPLIERGFLAKGHATSTVDDADRARALVKAEDFDLVIVDTPLVDADGIDELREACDEQRLHMIMMGAQGGPEERLKSLDFAELQLVSHTAQEDPALARGAGVWLELRASSSVDEVLRKLGELAVEDLRAAVLSSLVLSPTLSPDVHRALLSELGFDPPGA